MSGLLPYVPKSSILHTLWQILPWKRKKVLHFWSVCKRLWSPKQPRKYIYKSLDLLSKFYHKKYPIREMWKLLPIEKSAEILREREVQNCFIGDCEMRQRVLRYWSTKMRGDTNSTQVVFSVFTLKWEKTSFSIWILQKIIWLCSIYFFSLIILLLICVIFSGCATEVEMFAST